MIKWFHSLEPSAKKTWDCDYCQKKKLVVPRNCKGKYGKTAIVLTSNKMLTECPLGRLNSLCGQIYSTIKATLLSEFGVGVTPSVLLEELNILFTYRDVISKAESDFNIEGK